MNQRNGCGNARQRAWVARRSASAGRVGSVVGSSRRHRFAAAPMRRVSAGRWRRWPRSTARRRRSVHWASPATASTAPASPARCRPARATARCRTHSAPGPADRTGLPPACRRRPRLHRNLPLPAGAAEAQSRTRRHARGGAPAVKEPTCAPAEPAKTSRATGRTANPGAWLLARSCSHSCSRSCLHRYRHAWGHRCTTFVGLPQARRHRWRAAGGVSVCQTLRSRHGGRAAGRQSAWKSVRFLCNFRVWSVASLRPGRRPRSCCRPGCEPAPDNS